MATQRRMIYAKIWASEQFGFLSDKAKLLYIGTISIADDDGRLKGSPTFLKGQIFPYDTIDLEETLRLRNEVVTSGLLMCYKDENDYDFLLHPKWTQYQTIRKDMYTSSSLPKPIENPLHDRNGAVTEPLHNISKYNIRKGNRNGLVTSGATPPNPPTSKKWTKDDLLYAKK